MSCGLFSKNAHEFQSWERENKSDVQCTHRVHIIRSSKPHHSIYLLIELNWNWKKILFLHFTQQPDEIWGWMIRLKKIKRIKQFKRIQMYAWFRRMRRTAQVGLKEKAAHISTCSNWSLQLRILCLQTFTRVARARKSIRWNGHVYSLYMLLNQTLLLTSISAHVYLHHHNHHHHASSDTQSTISIKCTRRKPNYKWWKC